MYTLLNIKSGETLITEGTIQPYVFILKTGKLDVVKANLNSRTKLGEILPGEFVAEMAYLGSSKVHQASVIAASDCELIQIQGEQLFDVLCANPVWLKALLRGLVNRLENANASQVKKVTFL